MYNISRKLDILVSPLSKKLSNVVYGFKNLKTGQWLIGETEQTVSKRLSSYKYAINHPRKDVGKMPLPTAIRKHHRHFRFYVLSRDCKSAGELKKMEKAWIFAKRAFAEGYNQNRGGGGSSGTGFSIKPQKLNFDGL